MPRLMFVITRENSVLVQQLVRITLTEQAQSHDVGSADDSERAGSEQNDQNETNTRMNIRSNQAEQTTAFLLVGYFVHVKWSGDFDNERR